MTQTLHIQATGRDEQFEQLLEAFDIDQDAIEGSEKGFDGDQVRYWIVIPYNETQQEAIAKIRRYVHLEQRLD